ncbi:MAG: signal peptidase [marine bacterium B5-7]|nr:MAG: signal peptidase [marine bacterium B5-7]
MAKILFSCLACMMAMLFATSPAYSTTMPDEVVKTTINDLIDELERRRPELEQNPEKLYAMVEKVVVPQFDVPVIARLVLAKHWRGASEAQRKAFADAFQKLLIRTYATALFEYTGKEEMRVKPLRMKEGERKARVETEVVLPGASSVPVSYSFLLNDAGEWKVYDVNIDGISMVTNYRKSYGGVIDSRGLDALIGELKQKSVEAATKPFKGETG